MTCCFILVVVCCCFFFLGYTVMATSTQMLYSCTALWICSNLFHISATVTDFYSCLCRSLYFFFQWSHCSRFRCYALRDRLHCQQTRRYIQTVVYQNILHGLLTILHHLGIGLSRGSPIHTTSECARTIWAQWTRFCRSVAIAKFLLLSQFCFRFQVER